MDYKYIPFYVQGNAINGFYYGQWNQMSDRDIDYVKEMYPKAFAKIQSTIEEECDKMDYVGSPMYDEYPDKTRLLGIRDRIFEIVHMENAACENDVCIIYPEDDWLKDTIMVLLLYEIQRRNQ